MLCITFIWTSGSLKDSREEGLIRAYALGSIILPLWCKRPNSLRRVELKQLGENALMQHCSSRHSRGPSTANRDRSTSPLFPALRDHSVLLRGCDFFEVSCELPGPEPGFKVLFPHLLAPRTPKICRCMTFRCAVPPLFLLFSALVLPFCFLLQQLRAEVQHVVGQRAPQRNTAALV